MLATASAIELTAGLSQITLDDLPALIGGKGWIWHKKAGSGAYGPDSAVVPFGVDAVDSGLSYGVEYTYQGKYAAEDGGLFTDGDYGPESSLTLQTVQLALAARFSNQVGDGQITVNSPSPSTNATVYDINWRVGTTGALTPITGIAIGTNHVIKSLTNDTAIQVQVRLNNPSPAYTPGPYTPLATVTPEAAPPTPQNPLARLLDLGYRISRRTHVHNVGWQARRRVPGSSNYEFSPDFPGTSLVEFWDDTGLRDNTTYLYSLQNKKASGVTSPWGPEESATAQDLPPKPATATQVGAGRGVLIIQRPPSITDPSFDGVNRRYIYRTKLSSASSWGTRFFFGNSNSATSFDAFSGVVVVSANGVSVDAQVAYYNGNLNVDGWADAGTATPSATARYKLATPVLSSADITTRVASSRLAYFTIQKPAILAREFARARVEDYYRVEYENPVSGLAASTRRISIINTGFFTLPRGTWRFRVRLETNDPGYSNSDYSNYVSVTG